MKRFRSAGRHRTTAVTAMNRPMRREPESGPVPLLANAAARPALAAGPHSQTPHGRLRYAGNRRHGPRAVPPLAVVFLACAASAQSINNGGFEDGLPPGTPPAQWSVSGDFYHWTNPGKAHTGSQYAYFGLAADGMTPLANASGSIEQTINLPHGRCSSGLGSGEGSAWPGRPFLEHGSSANAARTALPPATRTGPGAQPGPKSLRFCACRGAETGLQSSSFRGNSCNQIQQIRFVVASAAVQQKTANFQHGRPSEHAPNRARLGAFFCGRFAVPLLERAGFAPLLLAKLETTL